MISILQILKHFVIRRLTTSRDVRRVVTVQRTSPHVIEFRSARNSPGLGYINPASECAPTLSALSTPTLVSARRQDHAAPYELSRRGCKQTNMPNRCAMTQPQSRPIGIAFAQSKRATTTERPHSESRIMPPPPPLWEPRPRPRTASWPS